MRTSGSSFSSNVASERIEDRSSMERSRTEITDPPERGPLWETTSVGVAGGRVCAAAFLGGIWSHTSAQQQSSTAGKSLNLCVGAATQVLLVLIPPVLIDALDLFWTR